MKKGLSKRTIKVLVTIAAAVTAGSRYWDSP